MNRISFIIKKGLKYLIAFAVAGAALVLLRPVLVNSIAFHPSRPMAYSGAHDFIHEKMITATDGISIHAYYLAGKSKQKKLLIYFHGNAGNNSHRIYDAVVLYKMGVDVLLVSYRGYGKSQGSPSEQGIYTDAESSCQYAVKELGYRESDIYVLGRSIGSAAAVDVAQHKDLAGVILVTPLTSGPDMAAHMGLGFLKILVKDAFDNRAKMRNIKAPLLIIHGTADRVVPFSQGQALFEAYSGTKKLVTIPDGRHSDLQAQDPQAYWGSIEEFVRQ